MAYRLSELTQEAKQDEPTLHRQDESGAAATATTDCSRLPDCRKIEETTSAGAMKDCGEVKQFQRKVAV